MKSPEDDNNVMKKDKGYLEIFILITSPGDNTLKNCLRALQIKILMKDHIIANQ